ncbi:mitochondrial thiamine pyrophosphate carrier [Scaptodrosophila lebanonensis]|uniref:Mitochondrial thiamine pyrophosphate carrier n=1 Tax=Drosophila lebanonensis TaxID=7225 RepID=A0A6J2UKU0_DROLE|nr:mitochondrial thiamine pyrophosphate carrier [Scaptodrosophila lebanonensis]
MTSDNSPTVQLMQAVSGGLSGACTRFITQPFDVLKIRFQMQVEPVADHHHSKYRGTLHALAEIYREEGIRGIWKGHNVGQMTSITYALVQFWSYEQFSSAFTKNAFFKERDGLRYFLSGGLAGCLGVTASQPFDLIRTMVVASDPKSHSSEMSTMRGLVTVWKLRGVRGLFRGLTFTLAQIFPLVGLNFLLYKNFNKMVILLKRRIMGPGDGLLLPPTLFVNGALAGVLSKAIVYPADFLKKRIQLGGFSHDRNMFGRNPNCPTLRECIVSTLEHEGIMGFYKGLLPTLVKSGLATAVYFTFYDTMKLLFITPLKEREAKENARNADYSWPSPAK